MAKKDQVNLLNDITDSKYRYVKKAIAIYRGTNFAFCTGLATSIHGMPSHWISLHD